ncbi:hypothetical protein ACFX1X_028909 [Malus domestica]
MDTCRILREATENAWAENTQSRRINFVAFTFNAGDTTRIVLVILDVKVGEKVADGTSAVLLPSGVVMGGDARSPL